MGYTIFRHTYIKTSDILKSWGILHIFGTIDGVTFSKNYGGRESSR